MQQFWIQIKQQFKVKLLVRSLLIFLVLGYAAVQTANYYNPGMYETTADVSWVAFRMALIYIGLETLHLLYRVLADRWRYRGFEAIDMPGEHPAPFPDYRAIRWTPEMLKEQREYFQGFPSVDETIVASAIIGEDGNVYAVLNPGRHHHCVAYMNQYGVTKEKLGEDEDYGQGFMTNTNRYVHRKDARLIALRAKQITSTKHATKLFSEDIWDTPEHLQWQGA